MSVLIKGMDEIPKDGAVLVVMHDNGKAYIKHDCIYGYSMELVKLPETHGRLIDADELENIFNDLGSRDYRRTKGTIMEAEKFLRYAPTVIEAEDREHERNEEA